jgi:flavin reductase (DIM6/NTAB) family NADH-FMN oxidoreductase RutF
VAVNVERSVDPVTFRRALGRFLTGVTVTTTCGPDGEPVGMTANAFSSVSLDPPLVLLCLARSAASFAAMEAAERYAVHILAHEHKAISDAFARSAADGADKFAAVSWHRSADGLPLLNDFLARLECTIVERVDAGDHAVYIARVDNAHVCEGEPAPLAFFGGTYGTLSR